MLEEIDLLLQLSDQPRFTIYNLKKSLIDYSTNNDFIYDIF
jgi:hypothetical protein